MSQEDRTGHRNALLTVRLDDGMAERLDDLTRRLRFDPLAQQVLYAGTAEHHGALTRSKVVRAALMHGLQALDVAAEAVRPAAVGRG